MTADDRHDASIRTAGRPLAAASLAVLLLVASVPLALAPAGAAQPAPELPAEPAFVVALAPDGSARTTFTVAFDLTTAGQRDAFEALRENATASRARTEGFAARMRAVADRAEDNAGREMRVSEPAIRFVDRGETGIIALSVTWEGLAARSGDALVLREPFASRVTFDRAFYVVAPAGYELASASPPPTDRTRTTATWAAGASIEGFEARFVPTDDGPMAGVSADAPGFGIGVAVLALVLGTGRFLHRRRGRP